MAANTDISLRNAVIYSIYVRNHTEEGTFLSVICPFGQFFFRYPHFRDEPVIAEIVLFPADRAVLEQCFHRLYLF